MWGLLEFCNLVSGVLLLDRRSNCLAIEVWEMPEFPLKRNTRTEFEEIDYAMNIARRTFFSVVFAAACLTMVHAEDAAKALAGTWKTDGGDGIDATWTFDGNKLKAVVNGNEYKAEFTVDEKAKPNATMDVTITESPEGDGGKKVGKAIYKLDGTKLTICVAMPGNERPKEFSTIDEVQYKFELKKQ